MSNLKTLSDSLQNAVTSADAQFPDLSRISTEAGLPADRMGYRFYRVKEITEGKAEQYRMAMANVLSNLANKENAIVYILSGKPEGIDLFIGVAGKRGNDVADDAKMLKQSFEGNFLGAVLENVKDDGGFPALFAKAGNVGIVTGVPSFNEENNLVEGEDFQSIERLVNTMGSSTWQMVVVAEPGSESAVYKTLSDIYDLSTRLSAKTKYSLQQSENEGSSRGITKGTSEGVTHGENKGESRSETKGVSESKGTSSGTSSSSSNSGISDTKGTNSSIQTGTNSGTSTSTNKGISESTSDTRNQGTSFSLTRENVNKHYEQIQSHLNDTQIERFRLGLSKGMFRAAVYLCSEDSDTYERLSRSVLAIFQGSKAAFTPLRVHRLETLKHPAFEDILQIRRFSDGKYLQEQADSTTVHSIPKQDGGTLACATWLNTRELALLTGLPCIELPGIKLRKSVSFAVNTVDGGKDTPTVKLGKVKQEGRILESKPVEIPTDALNKHVFVTGVTGAGKTTTCMKLLLETGFPFTVIEPAKTEYRALNRQVEGVQYYSLGREDLTTFRLNPFELVSKHQNLTGHISMLKATMAAVFPMEASMPFIIETAIIRSYQLKGWDIANNTNYLVDDPWNTEESVWPTFSEMIAELDNVIKAAGMGKEFEEKYRGSLVSRLESLTKGIRGTMINTPRSLDFDKLLDRKVVIELDELKDEEDKAFFMGLIIGRLAECMKQRHRTDNRFRHITLVEEAHRLLSKPEPGADGSKKLGVEMFANLLAEVRKYGECLVIADQIPNKLVSDVLKNTNTKIIHRLFAADDRSSIGDTMSLNDEQKDFLPLLAPGETVIYSGGWHAPVRAQIDQLVNTVAEEIEEGEIQKIGQEQLWLQSERLFPSVRRLNLLHTPEAFARAVSYARRLANMLVSVAQLADGNNGRFYEPGKTMAQKIAGRLAVQIAQMRQETALDRQTTAQLIAAVMKDAQPTGILNGQKNFAQLQTALDTLIGILETDAGSLTDRIAPDSKLRNAVTGTLGKCSLI